MAGKTYKLTATLSTGEEMDCGTFTAPQGPQGEAGANGVSINIGTYRGSTNAYVSSTTRWTIDNLSGSPEIGDTLYVIHENYDNGKTFTCLGTVISRSSTQATVHYTYVVETTGAQGQQGERGPQGPRGETGPAWGATRTYLTVITDSGTVNIPSGYSFIEILVQDDGADSKTPFLISRATLMDTSIAEQIKLPSIDGINDNIYLYATNSTTVYCNSGFSGFSVRFYGIR